MPNDFPDFCNALAELASRFDGVQMRAGSDADCDVVKIFFRRATALGLAKSGLDDVTELSLSAAEHHPYWGLLYQCCQICTCALERWDGRMSAQDIAEIRWSVSKLDEACTRLEEEEKEEKEREKEEKKATGKDKYQK